MAIIYLVSNNSTMRKSGERLILEDYEGNKTIIFPYKTEQLVVLGKIQFSSDAFSVIMKHSISVIFLSKNGRFNGKLVFKESKNILLRKKQFLLSDDENFRLQIAKKIVAGKIKNQINFMQRINRKTEESSFTNAVNSAKTMLDKTDRAANLAELRGYEGIAARNYFSVFKHNIKQDWVVFNGRKMNPPPDNVNAVLSFLYTLLMNRIETAIIIAGLDSGVSVFHEISYGKSALSFDLMEEFRSPICDTLTCALFNMGTLQEDDFEEIIFTKDSDEFPLDDDNSEKTLINEQKGVLLTKEGVKKVISGFEKKLESQILYPAIGKSLSYGKILQEQVNHYKRIIQGDEIQYIPMVLK